MTAVPRSPLKLLWWTTLVVALAVFGYVAYFVGGSPDRDVLYEYEVAIGSALIYAVMLGLVLAIAGRERELLALRPPRSWWRAVGLALVVLVAVFVVVAVLESVLQGGEEQGLTPTGWRPEKAGAYAANFVVLAGFVPIVEELLYRGLGYSLLAGFGQWPAILIVGVAFAADHGLVRAFPALFVFGCALAWLRSRTDSVYPCIAIHAIFNGAALIAAVASG
jgi:membrane protease YdiL (CAAX protease family)